MGAFTILVDIKDDKEGESCEELREDEKVPLYSMLIKAIQDNGTCAISWSLVEIITRQTKAELAAIERNIFGRCAKL